MHVCMCVYMYVCMYAWKEERSVPHSFVFLSSHHVLRRGSTETIGLRVRSLTTDLAVTMPSFGITTVI